MKNVIEGLQIIYKYYDNPDNYLIGAEHDTIYAYSTDREISETDVNKLIELRWFQDVYFDDEFTYKNYDPTESWVLLV